MCPEPVACHRVLLWLLGKLGFRNALGSPHNDPPLFPQRERKERGFEERKAKKPQNFFIRLERFKEFQRQDIPRFLSQRRDLPKEDV